MFDHHLSKCFVVMKQKGRGGDVYELKIHENYRVFNSINYIYVIKLNKFMMLNEGSFKYKKVRVIDRAQRMEILLYNP